MSSSSSWVTSRMTPDDVVQLAVKDSDFKPELSILSHFIDFFISLFGGKGKCEHLSEIHNRIYAPASSQRDKLAAIIELKDNTVLPFRDEFRAEVIVDRELLFSGKVKIISYFRELPLQQIELPSLDIEELFEHFQVTYTVSENSITNFSEFATGELFTNLNHLAKNTFGESNEQLGDRLAIWHDDVFLRFRLTFEVLRKEGHLPESFQSDVYSEDFCALSERIKHLLDSQPHHFTNEIESILNVAKTKIDDLINTLYSGVVDELHDLTTSFHTASMQDPQYCDFLFANILHKLKELVPFYESPLFYNKSDVAWNKRLKENIAMSAAMDIVDAYYVKQRLVKEPGMDLVPAATQRSVDDIARLLETYHSSHASSDCLISVESVNDYDRQYGLYQGYRVCLLQDRRILKAITIPNAALFLVHNHIAGDSFVEEDKDVYKKGGRYELYHIDKSVSKKSFLTDVSRYFCIRDLHCH